MADRDDSGWLWPLALVGGALALSGRSDGTGDDPNGDGGDDGDGQNPVVGEQITRSGSTNQTAEVAVYSTDQLKSTNGRGPERAAAKYVANAFDAIDVSVIVHYDLPTQDPPTEDAACGDTGALGWWNQQVIDGQVPLEAPRSTGSNILLTASDNGGCGMVCGRTAVAPAGPITSEPSYEVVGTGMDQWALQVVLHEVGHNFCGEHDTNESMSGNQHYGRAHNDDSRGLWVRTPMVAGMGVPNACGDHVFEKGLPGVGYEQAYTQCFRRHMKID